MLSQVHNSETRLVLWQVSPSGIFSSDSAVCWRV